MGIHGEPGVRRGPLETAEQIADQIVAPGSSHDLPYGAVGRGRVLVNGLRAPRRGGAVRAVPLRPRRPRRRPLSVRRTWVGEYATSLEMAGASVSVLRLDDELLRLLDAPCQSPFVVRR